jgi:hypothetical protein
MEELVAFYRIYFKRRDFFFAKGYRLSGILFGEPGSLSHGSSAWSFTVHQQWSSRHSSSILSVRPAPSRFFAVMAWGRSGGIGGAYQQRIAAEDGSLEVYAASNGGNGSIMVVVLMGELWRMTDGGGRRCSVERMVLIRHFILLRWCTLGNHGMGSAGGVCDSMARYPL